MKTRTKNGQWFLQSDDGMDVARLFGSGRFPPERTAQAIAKALSLLPRILASIDGVRTRLSDEDTFISDQLAADLTEIETTLPMLKELSAGAGKPPEPMLSCKECGERVDAVGGDYCKMYRMLLQTLTPCDFMQGMRRMGKA